MVMTVPCPEALTAVLDRQRGRGVLGPDSAAVLRAHSRAFARVAGTRPARAVDLGSGGGVPGLVLAAGCWPDAEVVLLDSSQRRCTYLEMCVVDLGLGPRVQVHWARAEEAGRTEEFRGSAAVVTARSFGPPAVTAECAAPLLHVGGVLVVSDPPGGAAGRWDHPDLGLLGLELEGHHLIDGASFSRLRQATSCPNQYPRRPGLPARRPLF